jgi:hypothetical protein
MREAGDITVLVCGGRKYRGKQHVFSVLDELHENRTIGLLVHGNAPGADELAEKWAKSRQVMYLGVPAPWKQLGNAAGPIRNSYMLDKSKPDVVIAFPGGRGTADMFGKAERQNVTMMDERIEA